MSDSNFWLYLSSKTVELAESGEVGLLPLHGEEDITDDHWQTPDGGKELRTSGKL
jgi:hypothetical protein